MARDMAAFRDAYQEVVDLTVPKLDFMMRVRDPKPGKEWDLAEAKLKAARLAGRARQAQRSSDASVPFSVNGGQIRLDPVLGWEYSLRDGEAMPPDALLATLSLMAGAIESKAEEAEHNERSLAGRVAAFVGFPLQVRALATAEHPSLAKAALATGIAAQVFAGVMATLIAALITTAVAALWKYANHDPQASKPLPAVTTPVPVPSTTPVSATPNPSRT
ncbi:hypothetical protein HC028_23175 [Planosporangium flavigriseum]|nr:hypothetical protein [Planosporangium flavigriseum]NJC67381.1 hypothetical protein [Planosporangium flavigriseum]